MSGPQLAAMAIGAMLDEENRLRGATLGFGVGTVGPQLASSAASAGSGGLLSASGGNVSFLPTNFQNLTNSLVAKNVASTTPTLLGGDIGQTVGRQALTSIMSPSQNKSQPIMSAPTKKGTAPILAKAMPDNKEMTKKEEEELLKLKLALQGNKNSGLLSIGNQPNALII